MYFPNNAFILVLIPLVFNLVWTRKLPAIYSKDEFVPKWILWMEHGFRFPAFFLPLLIPVYLSTLLQTAGIIVYSIGLCLYLISWVMQIYYPKTAWSQSLTGFLAPAYLPLVWMTGIALISGSWIYEIIVLLFVVIHVYHNYINYRSRL